MDARNNYLAMSLKEYLRTLQERRELIIIAVKATIGHFFDWECMDELKKLGIKSELVGKYWSSYLCVIYQKKIIFDKVGNQNLEYVTKLNNNRIKVISNVSVDFSDAKILIDDIDYSINNRGFNIVVFDSERENLVDSVCFDTDTEFQRCHRRGELSALYGEIIKLKRELGQIKKKEEIYFAKLERMIKGVLINQSENLEKAEKDLFRKMKPAKGLARKQQLAELNILKIFDKTCRENKISYWLHFGTLLGAFRHGGFIPWDDDLDIGMLRKDIERLKEAFLNVDEIYIDEKYRVNEWHGGTDHIYKIRFKNEKIPCFLDVFVYDYVTEIRNDYAFHMEQLKHDIATDVYKQIKKTGYEGIEEHAKELLENRRKKYMEDFNINEDGKYLIWAMDNWLYPPAYRSNCCVNDIFPLKEMKFEDGVYFVPQNVKKYLMKMYGDIYELPDDIISHKHFILDEEAEKNLDDIIYP